MRRLKLLVLIFVVMACAVVGCAAEETDPTPVAAEKVETEADST